MVAVAYAQLKHPTKPVFPSGVVLLEEIHSSVRRYQGSAEDVRDMLAKLPAILKENGFQEHDRSGQRYQTHEGREREDSREAWFKGDEHLFVFAMVFPNDGQQSQFAIIGPAGILQDI